MVVGSIFMFNNDTPHPSLNTIVPLIGAALIIGYSSRDDVVGKVLGSKPFVWVGLISYSAYLWHYPVFAFNRIGVDVLDNKMKLGMIMFIMALSAFSYLLVERPFRRNVNYQMFFTSMIFLFCFIVIVSSVIIAKDGFKARFNDINGLVNLNLNPKERRTRVAISN